MSKKVEEYLIKEYPITKKEIKADVKLSLGWALDFAEHYHKSRVNSDKELIDRIRQMAKYSKKSSLATALNELLKQ